MLLKTFKGRILAVSLGMTIVSVGIFGYGLAGIYYQHMHKCLNRSLSFLTNMIVNEYDLRAFDATMQKEIFAHQQLQNVLKGGLIDDLRIELLAEVPQELQGRITQSFPLENGSFFLLSSSTKKIDAELVAMVASRWIFFLFGFLFTSALIYLLVRHLFAPFNQLVNHCLTCDNPEKVPNEVSGGVEIKALRNAIATLQQRISRLQNAQHESMKALTHELKTPLAQLRLRIDLADQKGAWKGQSVNDAREEIDAISQKITQILHSTEHHDTMEKTNLHESLTELIEELRALWEHKKLRFTLEVPKTITMALPKVAFVRVLRILVENAINYSKIDSEIFIDYDEGCLSVQNSIAREKSTLIDSSGKGLQIAKTLSNYYCWELSDLQEEETYKVALRLLP